VQLILSNTKLEVQWFVEIVTLYSQASVIVSAISATAVFTFRADIIIIIILIIIINHAEIRVTLSH